MNLGMVVGLIKKTKSYTDSEIQKIQLLKGDKGDTGLQGAKGDKGDTGAKGADAVINKLIKVNALAAGADVTVMVTAFNDLISDLKAKGYMNN